MSVFNPLTAGCIDCNGCRIPNEHPYFHDKDRIFDPTNNPRYANKWGLPALLIRHNPMLGITHLHLGPDFGGKHVHKGGVECAEQDTVVMEVCALEMNGKAAGARWFAEESPYNGNSYVNDESVDANLLSVTSVGLNHLRNIHRLHPRITKAFIMTSSDTLIKGVVNLFNWTKNGFPTTIPEGLEGLIKYRLELIRDHLQYNDATGLDVKFWKVAPQFIRGCTFYAQTQLLDYFDVPHIPNVDDCQCGECIDRKQLAEVNFSMYGNPCRKDDHGIELAKKYGKLKKGDTFEITNNAWVTATIVMQVDAKGMVFCSDGTAKHADADEGEKRMKMEEVD